MTKSKNKKVQDLLEEIKSIDLEKYDTIIEMRERVFSDYPKVNERIMYGGIMFSMKSDDFCGLFVRKNHISFEFSNGISMNDPNQVLEGSGKFRRHLKIRSKLDIQHKDVSFFVKQASR